MVQESSTVVATLQREPSFKAADQAFASLLEWADQNTARSKYRDLLQSTKAHLVKLVMLGGLLEALFLARINRLTDPAPVFTATAARRIRAASQSLTTVTTSILRRSCRTA